MKRITHRVLKLFFVAAIGFVAFLLQSCRHEPVGIDNIDMVCFNTQVAPILVAQCSECHGADSPNGDYVIDSVYENVIKLVKPGDAWASKLYKIVSSPNNPDMMPPNKPLSKYQLTILAVWIEQGAKNTQCLPSANTIKQPIASNDGTLLYSTYCQGCHGALPSSTKIGATVTQIQTGISTVPDMKNLSILTAAQKQAIADVLAGTPDPNPDGNALYATACAKCHGPLATSSAGKASASKISNAIKEVNRMKYLSTLTSVQINAISKALQASAGADD